MTSKNLPKFVKSHHLNGYVNNHQVNFARAFGTNNKEDAEDLVNNIFLGIYTYLNKNINIESLENLI